MAVEAHPIVYVFTTIVIVSMLTIQVANSQQPDMKYFCSGDNGVPATVVKTSTWGNIPIIRWTAIENSTNQTPRQRCVEASSKLQKAYVNGTLRYIRTATVNNRSVICVAAYKGGSCLPSGELIVLNAGTKTDTALAHLIDLPTIRAKNPLYQNGALLVYDDDGEAYVNIESLIEAIHGIVL
jgi:Circadian oscillating protein COP23